jgi:NADH-quinone oxidoreductase subunit J
VTVAAAGPALNTPEQIAFGLIALLAVVGAVGVVAARNVVHAALYLVLVLTAVGASFLLVGAEFTGISQILVYVGAIVVLFLFGIMLTRAQIGRIGSLTSHTWPVSVVVAVALFGVMSYSVLNQWSDQQLPDGPPQQSKAVGDAIFGQYLVPFEVVSLLLLAALVGAIVLARKE